MKKIITGGAIALALTGAADAQAVDWTETKTTETIAYSFYSNSCRSANALIEVPRKAHSLEAVNPLPGQQFAANSTWGDRSGPIYVSGVDNLGYALYWTVKPTDWCSEFDDGWETDSLIDFSVRYRLTKRIDLTRNLARNLTEEVLARRYSWFDYANHDGYRCRISGNRGRCRHGFFIGDSAVIGVVKMRLVGRNGQKPLWNYKLNALQIDEYCRYVTPAGNCTTRIKKQRNRVSLPYWVRAKNA